MQNQSVAITGLGLMCGQGLNLDSAWKGLIEGKSVAKKFSLFDPEGLPVTFGVELPAEAESLFAEHIKPRSRKQMTRGTMIAATTASMAIVDAKLDLATIDSTRVGVIVGTTGTGYAPLTIETDEHRILRNMANAAASWISLREKISGPAYTISTACASGAYALHAACMLIASGQCDVVIAGAAASDLNRLDVQGFASLMALSERNSEPLTASRPFDASRNGFVMGEGSGMLVVESIGHAKKRGARIRALMPCPGLCSETYNILSPQPDGSGMARAMQIALKNAGLEPGRIDYINAHGTSTPQNDPCETVAIKSVFGDRTTAPAVSSTKSMTGHCLAGAAGVEAVIACKALEEGIIPPTINLTNPDPACDLDYTPLKARPKSLTHVMSNSFAFGGHNGVVIFSKP